MRLFMLVWLALGAILAGPVAAQAPKAAVAAAAPLSALVQAVDIPNESFTLPNGLRVVVHTDRKAPIVAVSVWFHIGSKDEPEGKSGFAHLYEHLLFYGSENNDENFFNKMNSIGATDLNGSTWLDRTNYYETVPTPALELALFLESDRMGHLLGAVTQEKIDAQRAVVQNEKRMGDNNPMGLTQYATLEALFPPGHPYRHSTIGSMADLAAASMSDVRSWFRNNYGPNNAVLVLAGDIDVATARPMVERYFGAIPRGPEIKRFPAPVPVWTTTRRLTMYDKIPTADIGFNWVVPGQLEADSILTNIATTVLAGGSSSRLYNDLVRDKKLAVSVSGGTQAFEKVSFASISATAAPGVDPKLLEARMDVLITEFLKTGPTADEVSRVATRAVAGTIRGLEQVGGDSGKAVTLAESALYAGDPNFFKTELARYAAATPETVLAAARKWLSRGDFRLTVMPGERPAAEEAPLPASAKPEDATPITRIKRMDAPKVAGLPDFAAPKIERATLSNGLKVELAQRDAVPVVRIMLNLAAGHGADDRAMLGVQGMALSLLDEGAAGMTGPQIAEARERLGASISAGASTDRTQLSLNALKPNLGASLALFADVVQRPDFPAAEVERVRGQTLAGIDQELSDPASTLQRLVSPLLYGTAHPYGVPSTGSGTPEGVKAVTRGALQAWHKRWVRPDNGIIHVVGDITLAELLPQLEASFGTWKPDAGLTKGSITFPPIPMATSARIILIDKPGSPQSYIRSGIVLPVKGKDDDIALGAAQTVLGGLPTSRLITNLRETKGWAYYAGSGLSSASEELVALTIAPVQTDKTGDSIAEIISDLDALASGKRPITQAERDEAVNSTIRSLPGDFESGGTLLGTMARNATLGRPDDYFAKLGARMEALTVADLNAAAKRLSSANLLWTVVGDRKLVEPQLKKLGLPVEVR